mmetsp:Transcript_3903/g.16233  ORF Transcript_3903/g.16233 Transcript_3903/m.16233 type:complete len:207 (+) Transcript_3903:187-807(+)
MRSAWNTASVCSSSKRGSSPQYHSSIACQRALSGRVTFRRQKRRLRRRKRRQQLPRPPQQLSRLERCDFCPDLPPRRGRRRPDRSLRLAGGSGTGEPTARCCASCRDDMPMPDASLPFPASSGGFVHGTPGRRCPDAVWITPPRSDVPGDAALPEKGARLGNSWCVLPLPCATMAWLPNPTLRPAEPPPMPHPMAGVRPEPALNSP